MLIPTDPNSAPPPAPTPGAPVPTSSAPNGGSGGGGSSPYYLSDPGYLAALLAQHTGDSQIQQMLNQEIARALISYGDPNLAKQAGFDLSAQAAAEARQNYLAGNATLARLDQAHHLQRQSIVNQLAGRGLLFSGETGYQRGQADKAYGNNVYDAQQAVLNGILGYRQNAMTQEQALQSQVISALENAYTNYVNSGQYGAAPADSSSTVPDTSANSAQTTTGGVTPAAAASQPTAMSGLGEPKNENPFTRHVVRQLVNPYTTGRKRFG